MVKRKLEELLTDFKTLREEWQQDKSNKALKRKFKKAKLLYKSGKQLKASRAAMVEAKEAWKADEADKKKKSAWKKAREAFRATKKEHENLLEPPAEEKEGGEATTEATNTETEAKAKAETEPETEVNPANITKEEEPVRVFAANLSFSIDEDALTDVFVSGGIKKSDILAIIWGEDKETCEFKGYAHIDFANKDVAKAALALSKTKVLGREMRLEMSSVAKRKDANSGFCTKIPEKPSAPKDNPNGVDRCFAGNLNWKIDEEKIKRAFEELELGVVHVFWVTDKATGQFYGSSFLTFETPEHAAWAVAYAEAGLEIMGRKVDVGFSPHRNKPNAPARKVREMSQRPEGGTCTAFFGNLSYDIDQGILAEFVKSAGEIKDVRWLEHKDTGDFKGAGFVEFYDVDAVDKVIKLNGEKLLGRAVRIDYG